MVKDSNNDFNLPLPLYLHILKVFKGFLSSIIVQKKKKLSNFYN